ncbi:MAG: alanine racemase [Candidatus Pacearchaeota archaeon]
MKNTGYKTWIEINRRNIENNYKIFRKIIEPKCQLMAVVKSNAYGHGLIDFSLEAQKLGVDWFGVDSVVEGVHLRQEGIHKKILALGYTLKNNFQEAIKNNISLSVSSFGVLKELENFYKKHKKIPKIHIKIDTGMHRQGFFVEQIPKVIDFLKKKIDTGAVEGVFTHFSSAAKTSKMRETNLQIKKFKEAISLLEKSGFKLLKHAAATAGTIAFSNSHFDMVRIGAGLYGLWPSEEMKIKFSKRIKIRPILTWKTIISEIKEIVKGEGVGYNLSERVKRNSQIGILPIGYWHGYPRNLSTTGRVVVGKKLSKIVGLISMDIMAIDITDIKEARVGNEVFLIGGGRQLSVSADDLARWGKTINYEITTRINPLIKKFIV